MDTTLTMAMLVLINMKAVTALTVTDLGPLTICDISFSLDRRRPEDAALLMAKEFGSLVELAAGKPQIFQQFGIV